MSADSDYFTIKYGPTGERLWAKGYDAKPGSNDGAQGVSVDLAGSVYVTGSSGTIKYDSEGNPLWTNSFGGLFVLCSTNDQTLIIATGWGTTGLKKFSEQGMEIWEAGVTNVRDISIAGDGVIYATALCNYDWWSSKGDIRTAKIAPDGTILWERTYDSEFGFVEQPQEVETDCYGNVLVAGVVDRTQQANQTGAADMLILKYSPDGNLLWTARYNDPANLEIAQVMYSVTRKTTFTWPGFRAGGV